MVSGLSIETAGLTLLRIIFTALCDRVVLRKWYPGLQNLVTGEREGPGVGDELELHDLSLPGPSIASRVGHDIRSPFRQERVARSIFSICFSESCILFLLFVCELLDVLDVPTRNLNISYSLAVLILLALVVIPLMLFSYIVFAMSSNVAWSVKATAVGSSYIVYTYVLANLPVSKLVAEAGLLSIWLSRLLAIGIVTIGILSGIGVVRSSWSSLLRLASRSKNVTTEDIAQANRSLLRVRADLADRSKEKDRRGDAPKTRNFISRWMKTNESTALQHEIDGLEKLEYHLAREHERLCDQYAASHQSIVVRCISYSLAIYCVLRVASSVRNLLSSHDSGIQQGPSSPDIAAQLISLILLNIGFSVDQNVLARQLSLLFIGILIAVNIRVVLRECLRFLSLADKQRGAPFMILLSSQLMAVYFLATLVQLLASLPPVSAHDDSGYSVFDKLPSFGLFSRLFDASFLLTVVCNVGWNSILRMIR